jgi:hypothetical protein
MMRGVTTQCDYLLCPRRIELNGAPLDIIVGADDDFGVCDTPVAKERRTSTSLT